MEVCIGSNCRLLTANVNECIVCIHVCGTPIVPHYSVAMRVRGTDQTASLQSFHMGNVHGSLDALLHLCFQPGPLQMLLD